MLSILIICIINNYASTVGEATMVDQKNPRKYKTKDICDRFDISRATLFRWESEGLLMEVGRDWRGWRVYDESNLKSIEKIIKGKNSV